MIDIKDRIPTNVLSNKAVRYGIYDEEGKLLRYEYIKKEDEPIEEGTPINKTLFIDLYGMNNYEFLKLDKQVDNTDYTARTIIAYGQVYYNASRAKKWEGWIYNKTQDKEKWSFDISVNTNTLLSTTTQSSATYVGVTETQDGSTYQGNLTVMNSVLTRSSYNSKYYMRFGTGYVGEELYFNFDFGGSFAPKLEYCFNVNSSNSLILQGSNNKEEWTDLHTLSSSTTIQEFTPTNKWRYYRIKHIWNVSGVFDLFIMRWYGVPDVARNIVNYFTSDKDLNIQKTFSVKTPEFDFENSISENYINNIKCEDILRSEITARLRYIGQKMELDSEYEIIEGTYTGNSSSSDTAEQSINLGFKPKALIVINTSDKYSMTAIGNVTFGTNGANQTSNSKGDLSYQSSFGGIRISENGFVAIGGHTSTRGFNYSGVVYTYIAVV